MEKVPSRVKTFTQEELQQDLEKYRQFALDKGAAGAAILRADQVHVDSRVRIKCCIPKCPEYGGSAHCPPNGLPSDQVKELVSSFSHAILVKKEVPAPIIAGESDVKIDETGKIIPNKTLSTLLKYYRDVNDIITEIESLAFYDGHYLATAFAGGSCRGVYCNFQPCQVLAGGSCRVPLKARPSMEGCSMDVFKMAAEAGWDIYPIGMGCKPNNVPHGTLVGLVLVE